MWLYNSWYIVIITYIAVEFCDISFFVTWRVSGGGGGCRVRVCGNWVSWEWSCCKEGDKKCAEVFCCTSWESCWVWEKGRLEAGT